MKIKYYILLIYLISCLNTYGQTINIHSVSYLRQSTGFNEYTLDGNFMVNSSRQKLLGVSNFSVSGLYPKSVSIYDGYTTSNSLTFISTIPKDYIFFFGAFNKLDGSLIQFTNSEIDSLYNWSKNGGKLIIAGSSNWTGSYETDILNSKWGFQIAGATSSFIPNTLGQTTDIFNGPFGNVIAANQGGGAQGYFSSVPSNSSILSTDANGNPTLIMDCNTLDLIISDVDGYTDLGGITSGTSINNAQDKFWANTIVFMDKLQPIPVITNISNNINLNSTYNNYQWYLNSSSINGATSQNYSATENGNYYVEVTMNGGCKIKSNIIIIDSLIDPDTLVMPNVFTPNGDGINDIFIPVKINGITINYISIYNRWGELMHKESLPKILWNGKTKNENASDGVYYWIVEYQNSKGTINSKTGFLQLLR